MVVWGGRGGVLQEAESIWSGGLAAYGIGMWQLQRQGFVPEFVATDSLEFSHFGSPERNLPPAIIFRAPSGGEILNFDQWLHPSCLRQAASISLRVWSRVDFRRGKKRLIRPRNANSHCVRSFQIGLA